MGAMDDFLGVAATGRNKLQGVNLLVVIVAIVLSCMVIHSQRECKRINDKDKYSKDSGIEFIHWSAVILLVLSLLLFVYDIYVMMK
jgi:heme/copper-type cytochrome/quinol oxidase subunit 2